MGEVNDKQRNSYLLTINNPLDHGFDHSAIKKTLVENFTTLKYFCMADEVGETGTYHTHVYVFFTSRVRFSKVKKHFESAHIDIAKGTPKHNLDYIQKKGKWAETEKATTSIDGTFEEWGDMPQKKGKREDMELLYEMIENGMSNAEIIQENPDFILHITTMDRVRLTLLTEKYKNTRRLNLKVIYISGETGTGKTRGVLDKHGDGQVYKVNDYKHPFDSYACQPVICFDEFRSQLQISDMLSFTDIYPVELPSRYANKTMCAETIYFTSNWDLEMQYKNVQYDNPTSWKAFLRRIKEVHTYNADGTITIYHSVDEYLNRDSEFHTISNNDNPFKEEEEK